MGISPLTRHQSQHASFDAIHGHLPVPVAMFDGELRVAYANAAWAALLDGIAGQAPDLDELPSVLDDLLAPGLRRARDGETVQLAGQQLPGADRETYWDIALSPLVEEGSVNGVVCVTHDATARVAAERVATANARLAAFRADVSQALASSDEIDDVLQACAEAMVRHAPAAFGRIWVLDEAENVYR
ncbi:MAG: PAS domain-containing protein, partial [Vicinamibacterales bacterium]